MKKNYFFASIFGLFLTSSFAQFTKNDVQYWVGTGADSAVVVIDFNDNSNTPSLAWGFAFTQGANITISTMLETLDSEVPTFHINLAFGFLNDINYDVHTGIGGTNSYYWGTYTGTSMDDFLMNNGITEQVIDGNWYGFNFTDWNPNPPYDALQDLSQPGAASNPTASIKESVKEKFTVHQDKNQFSIDGLVGNLSIVDLNGKVLIETAHSIHTLIDCSDFYSGLYVVSIQTRNGLVTKKVQF